MRKCLASAVFAGVLYTGPCLAADLSVTSCDGQPLAAAVISEREQRDISVHLAASAASAQGLIRLSPASGTARESVLEAGKAEFQEIGAGAWRLCTDPQGLAVAKVTIHEPRKGAAAAAAVLGAGAAGLGIVLAADSGGDSESRTAEGSAEGPSGAGGPPAGNNPAVEDPGQAGQPLIPEHPCAAAAANGQANNCYVNGPNPVAKNPISPSD